MTIAENEPILRVMPRAGDINSNGTYYYGAGKAARRCANECMSTPSIKRGKISSAGPMQAKILELPRMRLYCPLTLPQGDG